ncbi:MAG: NAD(P)H-binding protein [Parvularculaceae bacterium]|nr:NAD(P)H-binding protein [Parvularculaceae bacterium]
MAERGGRLAGRTVLVAGAGGFIGSRICLAAAREGASVRALARSRRTDRLNGAGAIEIVRGDLQKPEALQAAIDGCDSVVNAAYDFLGDDDEQTAAFDNLVGAAKAAAVRAFIQLSSIAVYDDWPRGVLNEDSPSDGPGSSYKKLKRAFERRLAASGLAHTILQPTIVYGAGGWQWTDRPMEELRAGGVILPDDPRGLCQAVHVDDVAEAVICALALSRQPDARYVISGPAPVEWGGLYAGYASIIGAAPPTFAPLGEPIVETPAPPSRMARRVKKIARSLIGEAGFAAIRQAAGALRKQGGAAPAKPSGALLELYRARGACSIDRARRDLGYEPKISVEEGLALIRAAYAGFQ